MAHKKDKYVDHVLVRYTPLQAIKDAAGFVARFFKFSNLKHGGGYASTALILRYYMRS